MIRRHTRAAIFVACFGLAALVAPILILTGGCGTPTPVAKRIDHVVISTQNPQELFNFFTGTLGLPVAWPMAVYPGFATGGIHLGNLNLEAVNLGKPISTGPTNVYGIVIEPYPLVQSVPELRTRGAQPGKLEVQTREFNGQQVTMWTNVTLGALSTRNYITYLCQYSPEAKQAIDSANQTPGPYGKLGVTSMSEVTVTSKDASKLAGQWTSTLAPTTTSKDGGIVIGGSSPGIKIVKGTADRIESIILGVASLSQARSYLEANGLLGQSSSTEVSIKPAKVQGINIRLVQKP